MKNIYLFTLALATVFAFGSCSKDDAKDLPTGGTNNNNNVKPADEIKVEKVQRSFFVDVTATWCGPCGQSGLPMFKSVSSEKADKTLSLALHPSNSELTPYYLNDNKALVKPILSQIFNSLGIPTNPNGSYNIPSFSLNNMVIDRNENLMKTKIDEKANEVPLANIGAKVEKSSTGLNIKTKTEFFNATDGEYFHAIFIMEDNVNNKQAVGGAYQNDFTHQHIVRDVVGGSNDARKVFGDAAFVSGSVEAGKIVEKEFSYEYVAHDNLPSGLNKFSWDNKDNIYVIATIWKKNGSKYEFVNGIEIK